MAEGAGHAALLVPAQRDPILSSVLGKPSNKKSGLVMKFFRKGFDPPTLPPLFLEGMEPMGRIGKKWPEHSL